MLYKLVSTSDQLQLRTTAFIFGVMKSSIRTASEFHPALNCAHHYRLKKEVSFHSTAILSAVSPTGLKHVGSQIQYLSVQIRLGLRFALLPLHHFWTSFTSNSTLLRHVINMDKRPRIGACVDMTGWSRSVHLTTPLPQSVGAFPPPWAFETRQPRWNHCGKRLGVDKAWQ